MKLFCFLLSQISGRALFLHYFVNKQARQGFPLNLNYSYGQMIKHFDLMSSRMEFLILYPCLYKTLIYLISLEMVEISGQSFSLFIKLKVG